MGKPLRDLLGQSFGRLTVISRAASRKQPNGNSRTMWLCLCSCGNKKVIAATSLVNNSSTSCGCFQIETHSKHRETYGGKPTREYHKWLQMRARCNNKTHPSYARYGGRGISVHHRWNTDFAVFLKDMGRCPPGFLLDRIDNNGPYSPTNCRWVSPKESANNRGTNRWIEFNGERRTLTQWAEKLGIHINTLRKRLMKWGLPRAFNGKVDVLVNGARVGNINSGFRDGTFRN